MEQLLIAALGAFSGWHFLKGVLPFRFPDRLIPLVLAAIAYGILCIPDLKWQIAATAGCSVPLLRSIINLDDAGPWKLPHLRPVSLPSLRRQRSDPGVATGQGFRPGGGPGRRIPQL